MSPFEINFSAMMVVSPDAFALHSYMGGRRKGIKIKSNLHLVVLKSQLTYTYIPKSDSLRQMKKSWHILSSNVFYYKS